MSTNFCAQPQLMGFESLKHLLPGTNQSLLKSQELYPLTAYLISNKITLWFQFDHTNLNFSNGELRFLDTILCGFSKETSH